MRPSRRLLAALLVVPAIALAACGSDDGGDGAGVTPSATSTDGSTPGPAVTTDLGVTVTGGFGEKPTLTIPEGDAPAELAQETLVEGTGKAVAKGETIVVNYLGQTWTPKDGQVNVFDNSYDRNQPTGFQIGTGRVIAGWDTGLVGKKAGDRVLLAIPAKDAYGAEKTAENELSGEPLVFVVDVLGSVAENASATGAAGDAPPAGFPAVTSAPGAEPAITSVAGVTPPAEGAEPKSALLIKGDGDAIDSGKTLAVQIVQTDTATGKQTSKSWGNGGAQLVPAEQVLQTVPVLADATVGSRALIVTPPTAAAASGGQAQPSLVVVVDVVAQF